MTVHAERLEAVAVAADAQGQVAIQLVRVEPDLEWVLVILHLFLRQRGDVPRLAGEAPAPGQFHLRGEFEGDDICIEGSCGQRSKGRTVSAAATKIWLASRRRRIPPLSRNAPLPLPFWMNAVTLSSAA